MKSEFSLLNAMQNNNNNNNNNYQFGNWENSPYNWNNPAGQANLQNSINSYRSNTPSSIGTGTDVGTDMSGKYNTDFGAKGSQTAYNIAGTGLQVAQGVAGLANAYTAYKQYKLAQDQYKFEKAATNRSIANQAQVINNQIDSAANIAGQLNRTNDMTLAQAKAERDRVNTNADKKKVDGSAL